MKNYLFFALGLFSLFLVNVKGAVLTTNLYSVNLYNSSIPFTFAINANDTKTGTLFYNLYDIERPQFIYLVFDVCTTANLNNVTISNTGYNAYFDESSVITYNSGITCYTNGYQGELFKLQVRVGRFVDSGGDGFNASSYLNIRSDVSYNSSYTFSNVIVTDEDVLFGLKQNNITNELQSDILNQQKEFNKKQDETNKKLDEFNKKQDETNKKLDDVKGAITSEDNPNLDGLNNSAGWLPNGPLDSILNLPLSLLENLSTNLSKTCQPITLPLPYVDSTIELPCISSLYSKIEGLDTWLNTIGIIASAFILFSYLVFIEKWADATLTLRENTQHDWGGI